MEVFVTTDPKPSPEVDGFLGLAPCGVKGVAGDAESDIWMPKSLHF